VNSRVNFSVAQLLFIDKSLWVRPKFEEIWVNLGGPGAQDGVGQTYLYIFKSLALPCQNT